MKKFSLVLCTLGQRTNELLHFFDSLSSQDFDLSEIELIIVDQNDHDDNLELLNRFPNLSSVSCYLKSEKGLSLSRNVGLQYVTGELVCFPDDDCIYDANILSDVYTFFSINQSISFISTNSTAIDSDNSLVNFPSFNVGINPRYLVGCSFTLFFRNSFISDAIGFDTDMGVGTSTIFGAGEEHDFMIRGMARGHLGVYLSNLKVFHPVKGEAFTQAAVKRRFSYSAGLAFFLLKNKNILGSKLIFLYCLNQFTNLFCSFHPSTFALNLISFVGFIRGFILAWLFLK